MIKINLSNPVHSRDAVTVINCNHSTLRNTNCVKTLITISQVRVYIRLRWQCQWRIRSTYAAPTLPWRQGRTGRYWMVNRSCWSSLPPPLWESSSRVELITCRKTVLLLCRLDHIPLAIGCGWSEPNFEAISTRRRIEVNKLSFAQWSGHIPRENA